MEFVPIEFIIFLITTQEPKENNINLIVNEILVIGFLCSILLILKVLLQELLMLISIQICT